MWDQIEPTQSWIRKQVPRFIERGFVASHEDSVLRSQLDIHTIRQVRCNIIAGATFALGFRFAGTKDDDVRALLESQLNHFKKLRRQSLAASPLLRLDRGTLDTFICVVALAVGMVDAGSGHLKSLSLLRDLRKVVNTEVCFADLLQLTSDLNQWKQSSYGAQMALHMAIGLLFLGGGSHSLVRSREGIAALLCSLPPPFPVDCLHNRYQLQALRHLYVLATEARCLKTCDGESGLPCKVRLATMAWLVVCFLLLLAGFSLY